MHAYKMTAALQRAGRSCAPEARQAPRALLRMDWGIDHGANKPQSNRLAEWAAELGFLVEVLHMGNDSRTPEFLSPPEEQRSAPHFVPAGSRESLATVRRVVFGERTAPDGPGEASYVITRVSITGDTVFSRHVLYDPVPIPQAVLDSLPDGTPRAYAPRYYPPVSGVVAGRDGTTWVARETTPTGTRRWDVFDETGTHVGVFDAPADLEIHDATAGRIWAVTFAAREAVGHVIRTFFGGSTSDLVNTLLIGFVLGGR